VTRALAVALFVVAGCAPTPVSDGPRRWTMIDMQRRAKPEANFGGFHPGALVVRRGEPLLFQPGTAAEDGLVVRPGLSAGASVPFVVTDIWQDHPTTWVQPVWVPLNATGQPLAADTAGEPAYNVFSVDVDSTFYSPFWQLENVSLPDAKTADDQPRSSKAMIDAVATRTPGPRVYCPVGPEGLKVARADGAAVGADPLTAKALDWVPKPQTAWNEGRKIHYLAFGPNRFQAQYQLPERMNAYFFVKEAGGLVLPIATVFPAGAREHSFVQRIDVVWPAGAVVYVPSTRPELRAALIESGVPFGPNDPMVPDQPARTLQVAMQPQCFTDSSIDCGWLDSEEAIRGAGLTTVEQDVQYAVGVLTR